MAATETVLAEQNKRLREIILVLTISLNDYCVLRSTDGQLRKCIVCGGIGRGEKPVKHESTCPLLLSEKAMQDPNLQDPNLTLARQTKGSGNRV